MTKTCPNCFSPNVETNKFCSNCGTSLQAVAASAPADSPGDQAPFSGATIPMTPPVTAYVVKTTSDAEGPSGDPQAPTVPMSTFVPPPAPSGTDAHPSPSGSPEPNCTSTTQINDG